MSGIENYFGFIIAGIIMNLTPGADTIYIITRSIAQGKKAGIYSVLGIGTGIIIHILLAGFGLSVILAKSMMLFIIIKWIGALYLIYLGIKMFLDTSSLFNESKAEFEKTNLWKIYKQGFITNLFNPKVAFFFLSFIPQFISPEYVDSLIPFLILGGTFMLTGTIWCLFLAYSASFMTDTLRRNHRIGKIMKKISGFVFVSLGLQLLIKRNWCDSLM